MAHFPDCFIRRGFSLMELLVVTCLLGTLVALLLPAVQAARESARRAKCQSNLQQWGIALALHEQYRGTFPPGFRPNSPTGTFVPHLLPFIEQQNIAYNTQADWDHPTNQSVVRTSLALMWCPSSPTRDRLDESLPDLLPVAGDYVSTHGVNAKYCMLVGWPSFTPPDENGILTQAACRAAEVTDGLTQTLTLIEDSGRPELWKMGHRIAGTSGNPAWADPGYEVALDGSDELPSGAGQGFGPCVMNCTNDNEAYSFHPIGCNLLFADGGVRFVSQRVNNAIFAAFSTRAGNDFIGAKP